VGGCSWAETGQQIGDPRLDVPALNPEVGRQLVFLEECYELPQRLGVGLDGAPSLVLGLEVQDQEGSSSARPRRRVGGSGYADSYTASERCAGKHFPRRTAFRW
jgi:hypothetical protein